MERVIIKALLNAPDQALQLLLNAEQRGEAWCVPGVHACISTCAACAPPGRKETDHLHLQDPLAEEEAPATMVKALSA